MVVNPPQSTTPQDTPSGGTWGDIETLALDAIAVVAIGTVLTVASTTGRTGFTVAVGAELIALLYLAGHGILNSNLLAQFTGRLASGLPNGGQQST